MKEGTVLRKRCVQEVSALVRAAVSSHDPAVRCTPREMS